MAFYKKKQFWGSIIAVALLAFCIKGIEKDEMLALFKRVDYFYFILAVLFSFAFILTKGFRWKLMLSQQKPLKAWRALSLYSAGQILNIIMPMLTGQVGRMFLFSKNEGLKKSFIFSTIVLEILFDSLSLILFLLLTSIAFVFPEKYRYVSYIIASITFVLIVILYLILHYQNGIENRMQKSLKPRWPSFYIGTKKFIRSFVKGINLLKSSQHFFGSLAYSIASWITHTLVVYFLLKSFGFELPFAAAATIMIINTLALMIPITPGNAGTFEVAVSSSLAAFGVGHTEGVLFAIALHLLDLIPIGVLGYAYLHTEKVSISEIKAKHEDDNMFDKVSVDGSLIENETQQ